MLVLLLCNTIVAWLYLIDFAVLLVFFFSIISLQAYSKCIWSNQQLRLKCALLKCISIDVTESDKFQPFVICNKRNKLGFNRFENSFCILNESSTKHTRKIKKTPHICGAQRRSCQINRSLAHIFVNPL